MPIGTFVAGRYTSTYAAADVGIMQKGYELEVSFAKQLIQDTDAYADSVIDGVHRGGNVFCQFTAKEWKAGPLNVAFPYATWAPTGNSFLGPGTVGRLDSNIAGILILTATAGTPAAATPASLTATYSIVAENFSLRWIMGPEHRLLPVRMRFLLYNDAGTPKWFTTT